LVVQVLPLQDKPILQKPSKQQNRCPANFAALSQTGPTRPGSDPIAAELILARFVDTKMALTFMENQYG